MLRFSNWKRVCGLAMAAALLLVPTPRVCLAQPSADTFEGQSKVAIQRRIEAMQDGIVKAQQQLLVLLSSGATANDEGAKSTAQALGQEIATRSAELEKMKQMLGQMREREGQQSRDAELAKLQAELAKSQNQVAELNSQLAKLEQEREEQPIDNAEFKIFSLKNLNAQDASFTIQEILSGSPFRISVDHRGNSLVVAGDEKTLQIVEALLLKLDDNAGAAEPAASRESARSLLVRIFWLADGLPEGEGEEPRNVLPGPVRNALEKLGLVGPRIVGQTVNAISRNDNGGDSAKFRTSIPALLFNQPAALNCSGDLSSLRDDRAELYVAIQASGPSISTDLSGSVVAPLGHYMVLGTSNSLISEAVGNPQLDPVTGMGGGLGGGGMDFGGGRGGFDGGRGGYGGRGEGGLGMAAQEMAGQPTTFKTSRFAFVVQVVEAESFAPEADK
jgi:hypothetical protein